MDIPSVKIESIVHFPDGRKHVLEVAISIPSEGDLTPDTVSIIMRAVDQSIVEMAQGVREAFLPASYLK
jgi:hypothetical protein